ncbi:alanine acetyltransferase [Bowmanella pacifica]|uniref:Alanine acetyltransferase n=2 Tax=Bowmanella pacifica TaxID=502051 RepID=A0A917Z420_9ALTE|nr:alanine acetyltransferase [Bowmanella pacifica]
MKAGDMVLATNRLTIRVLHPHEWEQQHEYEVQNKDHLAPWEPLRAPDYFTPAQCQARIAQRFADYQAGCQLPLVAFEHQSGQLVAQACFSQIVRGPFQACYLGYSIDHRYQGQGLMYEMLSPCIEYIFGELTLNRIMANYLPDNQRSARLLARLGFAQEGLAKRYLKINGHWRDHVLMAKLSPYQQ